MRSRVWIAIACLVLVGLVVTFHSVMVPIVGTALALGCVFEVYRAYRCKGHGVQPYGPMAFAALMFPVHYFWGTKAVIALYLGLSILSIVILCVRRGSTFQDVILTQFLMFYPNTGYLSLMLINAMQPESMALMGLGTAFLVAGVTDIFAYLGGRFFGKHKLFPEISPNKTDEGSLCGLLGGAIAAVLVRTVLNALGYAVPLSLLQTVLIGLIASILGQLGDLIASAIKRYTGIKDFGTWLAAHGGLMDRMDSSLLTAFGVYFMFMFMV